MHSILRRKQTCNKPSLQSMEVHLGKTSGESDLKNVMSLGIIGVMKKILGKIFEKRSRVK